MTVLAYLADPAVAALVGELAGVRVVTETDGRRPPGAEDAEIYVPRFLAQGPGTAVLAEMPHLALVQLATAGAEAWLDKVPPGVTLATARGAHGASTAEWALGALIAVVRDFPAFVDAQREGRWSTHPTDRLAGKRALIVGAGDLGDRIAVRLRASDVEVTMVARTARDGVHPITEVASLLPTADVVVLVVPLTDATAGLVDAAFLAAMPDGAVLVNAARGPIVDTGALVAELTAGRLRAALDVTDPEPLPAGHPLWELPNVFITPHVGGSAVGASDRAAAIIRDQLRRYVAGEPVQNVVTDAGY